MSANRLKKSSSGPMTMLGLTIVASGKASRTAASPAALERAYSAVDSASAPMAEICTSRPTPASADAEATAPAPAAWMAAKDCGPRLARTPTQLTTASTPSTAARTLAG